MSSSFLMGFQVLVGSEVAANLTLDLVRVGE